MFPIFDIFFFSILTAFFSALLIKKIKINYKDFIFILLLSLTATLASLCIRHEGYSGTGWRILYGWPHFFFINFQLSEDVIINDFLLGPLGSYFFINIFFYFSIFILIFIVLKILKRIK